MEEKWSDELDNLIVIGDRVLIQPDEREERTKVGLYLPQTVKEKEEVASGYILKTGPGLPLVDPSAISDEPWQYQRQNLRYIPMEARVGDYAIFLRKASVEITFRGDKYFIVPQSAILLLVRENPETAADINEDLPLDDDLFE